ncbi:hypothetical protein EAO75_43675 [Streptomyces sp. uw30]|nr:hypothetical protein EAO75_43675 [Streptomyces sp. uw30]
MTPPVQHDAKQAPSPSVDNRISLVRLCVTALPEVETKDQRRTPRRRSRSTDAALTSVLTKEGPRGPALRGPSHVLLTSSSCPLMTVSRSSSFGIPGPRM